MSRIDSLRSCATALVASAMLAPSLAHALSLEVTYGATTFTCADATACDLAAVSDVITTATSLGPFSVSINTGANSGASVGSSLLALTSFSVSSGSTGATPLIVKVSETNYAGPSPTAFDLSSALTQGTGASVTFRAYKDDANTLFGTGTLLGTQVLSTASSSSSVNDILFPFAAAPGPYSVTLVAEILTNQAGIIQATTDIAATTAVPVPAAVWFLGSAVVGLAGIARRRRG